MTTFDYAKSNATALRLLTEFGHSVTLKRVTGNSYNPATGTNTPTYSTLTGTGADFDYTPGEVTRSGGLVQVADRKLYLATGGITSDPLPNDLVIIGAVTWTVMAVARLAPGGVTVLYTLQLRK